MRPLLRWGAALAAALLVAGCTMVRFAYDSADTYLHYRINNYLDLDAKGSEELAERIAEFFAWHRRHALPQYAATSDEAARRLARGLEPEDVAWGYESLLGHARHSLRFGAERIAPLLDGLSAQQVANIEKRFADDNRRFAREHLRGSEAERRRRRAVRVEERIEAWIGRLSAEQREKLKQYSDRAPLYDELRSRDRRRMQAELIDMINRREAQARLADWIAHWERGRDPAHVAAAERARREFAALLLELDPTLSAEQRSRAEANLRRYAEDFRILAQRAGGE